MSETVPLHYQIQGEGPALFLLHGLFGSGQNWRRIAASLHSRRVYLLDLRNHGRSPHHPDCSYPAMAADVLAVMDRLGLGQVELLGHSMGGKVAMWLALAQPQRVRRLLVADIAPVTYDGRHGDHAALIDALLALDLGRLGSRREAEEQLAGAIPALGLRQFLLTNLLQEAGTWQWRIPLGTLRDALPSLHGFPEPPGRYSGPTLFLHAAASGYVTAAHHPVIRALFPQAQICTLSGAGHWLHVDDPEGFVRRVMAFLEADQPEPKPDHGGQ